MTEMESCGDKTKRRRRKRRALCSCLNRPFLIPPPSFPTGNIALIDILIYCIDKDGYDDGEIIFESTL